MDDFKKEQLKRIGIGGLRCYCCNDFYGKTKSKLNKAARTAMKREVKKIVNEENDK